MKIKFDPRDFLLRRGEFLAMGVAGFCLVVLLAWGASKWASAENPTKIAEGLGNKSAAVKQAIEKGEASAEDKAKIELPPFLKLPSKNTPAKTADFATSWHQFDPTAAPNTKRENPTVYNIGDYQVDLIRSAMPGYDIIYDNNGEPLIAVLTTKAPGNLDKDKLNKAAKDIKDIAKKGQINQNNIKNNPPPKGPGGMGPGPGGDRGPGGERAGPGGPFEANGRRADEGKVIEYVPLKNLDAAITAGKLPALTVIPLRMVTIHGVVPYKRQLEEIKRALRLATEAETKEWGPWYDGFEIQRRETRRLPDGSTITEQEWADPPQDPKSTEANYKFEERYIDRIDTRKVGDHFDEGFLPYFLKPDLMLSMPLPLLAPDLNVKYPEIRLKAILDNIKKLEEARQPKLTASEIATRLGGRSRNDMYNQRPDNSGGITGGSGFGGPQAGPGGPPMPITPKGPIGAPPPRGSGRPQLPEGFTAGGGPANPTEVENFLLRFVDCDVKPGRTYEYRVRLRMVNPNYSQDKLVANPVFATDAYKILYSKWDTLDLSITVPAEDFLYAFDTKTYREQTAEAYKGADQSELLRRMQLKDNQAVVQVASWMEQVRTDAGTKREPVGAWVVTEIPVGRGEYIGRKQYIRLPLWSSETQQYVLREVADKIVVGGAKDKKDQPQPKGWMVNFSTKSILVDFEGGKVKTKTAIGFDETGKVIAKSRTIDEEAATELLIVHPDGKLEVRSSKQDEADETRKDVASRWAEWLKLVEGRGAGAGGVTPVDPFAPKKP